MNFEDNEEEEIKTKNKMYAITFFSIIGVITIFIIVCFFSLKSFFISLTPKKEYFVLNVNDKNKEKIIELFNNEKENMFPSKDYCESMYKIEYYNLFPDGTDYTMYCKDEDNINFGIDKAGEDTLAKYIYETGKRKIK